MSTQTPAPATDERRGTLRGAVDGIRSVELTTSQKLMVFVLSMSLFGLSNIILEIIPDPSIGPVDISVSYMVFVPLTIAALFSPFWAALGAPLGEIVFTDLLMGDFSGLAEIEGYLQMFLAVFIAGSLIRNPGSKAQIAVGAIVLVLVDKILSAIVDLSKVWIGVVHAGPGDPGPGRRRRHVRHPAGRDPRDLAHPRPAREDRAAHGHAAPCRG
jgi:hypothetical protein